MDKNTEKRLLAENNIDNLISMRIEEKIEAERQEAKKVRELKKVVVKDFSQVPDDKIFSNQAVYLVFNRKTKLESFINGVQAESLIGLNKEIRQNLLNKFVDNFAVSEYFVKFNSYSFMK